jgi:hypothetical protein
MKKQFRLTLGTLTLAVIAVPVSFIITFVLAPFWNWFESVTGIESIGHSGPANWCFILIFVVLYLGILIVLFYRKIKKKVKVSPEK